MMIYVRKMKTYRMVRKIIKLKEYCYLNSIPLPASYRFLFLESQRDWNIQVYRS